MIVTTARASRRRGARALLTAALAFATFPAAAQAATSVPAAIAAPAAVAATEQMPSLVLPRAVSSRPRGLIAVPLDGAVRLRWKAPASNGGNSITGYRIERSSPSGNWTRVATTNGKRSTTVRNLTNGDSYRFRVAALNASGTGTFSKARRVTLPIVRSVHGGFFHTCAVLVEDRGVSCWGNGVNGQMGDGQSTNSLTPVRVPDLAGVRALAVGEKHNCAIVAGRFLECWGGNDFGQIDNSLLDRSEPTQHPVSGVIGVSAGQTHTCALLVARTVRCWGNNNSGQLGTGDNDPVVGYPDVVGLSDVRSLSMGHFFSCAVLLDRTVRCWGQNGSGQLGDGTTTDSPSPVTVTGLTDVRTVSAGANFACATKVDRTVVCWGDNTEGQIGDTTTNPRPAPTPVTGLASVAVVASGRDHSCALRTTLTVRCWGDNTFGEIGDGTTDDRTAFVAVPLASAVLSVGAGNDHTCAALRNAEVYCWGLDTDGQLGDGEATATPVSTPVRVLGL
jgi:alpha-tubulin suppressor-like RCC1 family protein